MIEHHRPGSADPPVVPHWFDFVCPFCYVAQHRNGILQEHGLRVVHLAFRIHPEIPPEGVEAGPRDGPMYAMLEREAARAGLPLRWPPRLPDTRTALAAAAWVARHRPDRGDALIRALFAARFALGEDLGDPAVIDRHAAELGIDLGSLHGALADGGAAAALAAAETAGAEAGVRATPSWLIAGELVSGLLPPQEFHRLAEKATGHGAGESRRTDGRPRGALHDTDDAADACGRRPA